MTREGADNQHTKYSEQDLKHHSCHKLNGVAALFTHILRDGPRCNARKEHNEGVYHTLEQGHRNHIAVSDVRYLVASNPLDLVTIHRL